MANRYWVGGSATWDATAGTKWALTSGGAGGQAVPTSSDAVFFDAASGAVTVTTSGTFSIGSLDCTGFTGALEFGSAVTCIGAAKFASGMTSASDSGSLRFNTSGASLDPAGISYIGTSIVSELAASGNTFDLLGNLNCFGLGINGGTFRPNNHNVTIKENFTIFGAVTKTVNFGSGQWTFKNLTVSATGTKTFNFNSAKFKMRSTDASEMTISGASLVDAVWPKLTIDGNVLLQTGTLIANTLIFTANTSQLYSGAGLVIQSSVALTMPQNAFIRSNSVENSFKIVGPASGTVTITGCAIQGLVGNTSGGCTYVANNCLDMQQNLNITFNNTGSGAGIVKSINGGLIG